MNGRGKDPAPPISLFVNIWSAMGRHKSWNNFVSTLHKELREYEYINTLSKTHCLSGCRRIIGIENRGTYRSRPHISSKGILLTQKVVLVATRRSYGLQGEVESAEATHWPLTTIELGSSVCGSRQLNPPTVAGRNNLRKRWNLHTDKTNNQVTRPTPHKARAQVRQPTKSSMSSATLSKWGWSWDTVIRPSEATVIWMPPWHHQSFPLGP
jgi:hypothetical protein